METLKGHCDPEAAGNRMVRGRKSVTSQKYFCVRCAIVYARVCLPGQSDLS